MLNNSQGKKHEVEDQRRNVKFYKNKTSVTACNDSLKAKTSNVNFVCATCGKYVLNDKHDMCVLKSLDGMNSRTKMPIVVPVSTREPKLTVKQSVAKPLRKTVASESNQKPRNTTRKLYERVSKACSWWYPNFTPSGYKWKPKSEIGKVNLNVSMPLGIASRTAHILEPMTSRRSTVSNTPLSSNSFVSRRDYPIHRRLWLVKIILFIIDYWCSKHMTGNLKLLTNFVEKFLGTVKFGNDQIELILGYGDLVQGKVTIKKVYYVEGLNHYLFSVGQFCDADLEVAFWKSTCYICDLKGNDLLTCSRGTDLYSITLQDTFSPTLICLMAKATSSQAWLWHRRLSHLNFDTINLLSKDNIVTGLPKLKFVKNHLCSSCTEFLNKTLHSYFAKEGIRHETSIARTPEQNSVVKRRNRTLDEAARTMLSVAKVPLFFWVEAIATAWFTQNRSLVIPRHEKTPYHIINGRKPSVKFFHIFGSICYIIRDGRYLDKMKEMGDAFYFVGYSTQSRAYKDHVSSDLVPQCPTTALEHNSLSPDPQSQENVPHAAETVTTLNELDLQFSPMFDELLNGSNKLCQSLSLKLHKMHKLKMTNLSTSIVHRYKNEGRHRLIMLIRQGGEDNETVHWRKKFDSGCYNLRPGSGLLGLSSDTRDRLDPSCEPCVPMDSFSYCYTFPVVYHVQDRQRSRYTAFSQGFLEFFFLGAKVGALGSSGALKPSTQPVMAIFMYPLGAEVEAACALEVKVEATCLIGALEVEVEATCLVEL
nr:integrase, catalytic region, zinc finger, CCHC-type, peptidase aspartic, catalytic [Tanacetum cinerariifolium]